ncbi:MAG TPA: enoyl-CoA hydratase-related protein [Actinomycetota bacterium]|nr:enoyl-CoA hydratase-related protein [Actinomycetota bacterium]
MSIDVLKEPGLHVITINRPERRNALDLEHFGALADAWIDFRDDADARVAIITGTGRDFCVGADLKSFVPMVTDNIDELASGKSEIRADAGLVAVLREFELFKPVIAAVNGTCTAGGMEMLLGTDIRIASPDARFGVAEPKRGLFPGGGTTVRLPRQIPFPWAMEILLTAEFIDADTAARMGIVNRVVPAENLLVEARAVAARIMENAPLAVQAVKQSVLTGLRMNLKEAFEQELMHAAKVFMTEDAKEGPRAFAEKRAPVWKAR